MSKVENYIARSTVPHGVVDIISRYAFPPSIRSGIRVKSALPTETSPSTMPVWRHLRPVVAGQVCVAPIIALQRLDSFDLLAGIARIIVKDNTRRRVTLSIYRNRVDHSRTIFPSGGAALYSTADLFRDKEAVGNMGTLSHHRSIRRIYACNQDRPNGLWL